MTVNKHDVMDHLHRLGVVAVVRCQTSERLTEVVAALCGGGIRAIEITLTTPGAVELIRDIAAHFDRHDALVGAGTVVDVSQAAAVIDAGAQYVVSPTSGSCRPRTSKSAIPGAKPMWAPCWLALA